LQVFTNCQKLNYIGIEFDEEQIHPNEGPPLQNSSNKKTKRKGNKSKKTGRTMITDPLDVNLADNHHVELHTDHGKENDGLDHSVRLKEEEVKINAREVSEEESDLDSKLKKIQGIS
jgi:hypothetical protein